MQRSIGATVAACGIGWLPAQAWQLLEASVADDNGVAYDQRRACAVALDHRGGVRELHRWRWLRRPIDPNDPAPVARTGAMLVYDEARRHVLLFGGSTSIAPLGDTWAWDGAGWRPMSQVVSPPRRLAAAGCYDPVRQRVVMFGGLELQFRALDDTWEHDGSTWLPRSPVTTPAASTRPRMAYDHGRGVAVLVTGSRQAPQAADWDGNDWRVGAWPAHPPMLLQYDRARAAMLFVDGAGSMQSWDGTSTSTLPNTARWLERNNAWFDPDLGMVVAAGRLSTTTNDDLVGWNDAQVVLAASPRPELREARVAARGGGELIVYGLNRLFLSGPPAQTWRWDGDAWTHLGLAGPLPVRGRTAMTADPARGRVLLFGGRQEVTGTLFGDLWEFDGATWQQLPATGGPQPRMDHGLAFDRGRGVLVLFGGDGAAGLLDDTWHWNGAAWSQVGGAPGPNPAPAARRQPRLVFDPLRAVTVMCGGTRADGAVFDDTWEWAGAAWSQTVANGAPRDHGEPTFDPVQGGVVMPVNVAGELAIVQYTGTGWNVIARDRIAAAPMRLGFDDRRDRLLAIEDSFAGLRVWERTPQPAAVARLGGGCGAASPQLSASTPPRTGAPDFGLEVLTAAFAPTAFALALSSASTPVGNGCQLAIGPAAALTLAVADRAGVARQPIGLPPDPALRGVVVFAQAGALIGGAAMLTAGLRIEVGD